MIPTLYVPEVAFSFPPLGIWFWLCQSVFFPLQSSTLPAINEMSVTSGFSVKRFKRVEVLQLVCVFSDLQCYGNPSRTCERKELTGLFVCFQEAQRHEEASEAHWENTFQFVSWVTKLHRTEGTNWPKEGNKQYEGNYRGHMYMCVSLNNNNNIRNMSGTVSAACALQSVAFWV